MPRRSKPDSTVVAEVDHVDWCKPTSKGLEFNEGARNVTFDDWGNWIVMIGRWEAAKAWIIGDALSFGSAKFGDMHWQALDMTDWSKTRLEHAKWLSKAFTYDRRRGNLSWSHHESVAPLSEEEQDKLLDFADENDMERDAFRDYVRAYRGKKAANANEGEGGYERDYPRRGEIDKIKHKLFTVVEPVRRGHNNGDPLFAFIDIDALDEATARLMKVISATKPFQVCPLCSDGCEYCKQLGWVPKWKWDEAPSDMRDVKGTDEIT